MEQEYKKKIIIEVVYLTVIGLLVYFLCRFLFGSFLPFLIAFFVGWFVQKPAVKLSEKLHLNKGILAVVFSVILYVLTAIIISFLVYFIIITAKDLFDLIPNLLDKFVILTQNSKNLFEGIFSGFSKQSVNYISNFMSTAFENFGNRVSNYLSKFIAELIRVVPSFLISSIVALVASCYFAKDYDKFIEFLKGIFSEKTKSVIVSIKTIISENIFKILKGYLILFFITFIELIIGLFALKINYALTLAFVIALVDLLPVLGTGAVLIPWGIIEIAFGSTGIGIGLFVLYLIITIVRNFLEPKIIASQIGINSLFTLFAMFLGLKLLGFVGVIIFPTVLIVLIKYYEQNIIG